MNPDINPSPRSGEVWKISSSPVISPFEAKVGQVFLLSDGHYMLSVYGLNYYLVHLERGKIVVNSSDSIAGIMKAYGLSEKNLRKNLTFC